MTYLSLCFLADVPLLLADQASYQAGQWVGRAFVVVFVLLVLKKLFTRDKK
jgi:hypothetical protein